jgi:biopolymer transport protein ExbB
MRQRRWFGWFGSCLLSYGLLAGAVVLFASLPVISASQAVAAEGDKTGDAPEKEQKSFLKWLYDSLTLRYVIIFLFITFNLVALLVMNIISVWRDNMVPPVLVQEFEEQLNQKQYQQAYETASNDGSFLGKVLAAGMGKLSAGYEEATKEMQTVGEEENMKLEQKLGYVALCAQIGPMFGLLGTVDGMVTAFDVIANSDVTPRPSELAQGIGTALVTTVVGLWIAIPSIAYYHIVRNFLTKRVAEAGVLAEELMKRFAGVAAASGAAAAGAAAAAAKKSRYSENA